MKLLLMKPYNAISKLSGTTLTGQIMIYLNLINLKEKKEEPKSLRIMGAGIQRQLMPIK
jgi:hypothetical protein